MPSAKIVMLTISDEEEDLFEAIRAGASGYLLKDIPLDEVAEAAGDTRHSAEHVLAASEAVETAAAALRGEVEGFLKRVAA